VAKPSKVVFTKKEKASPKSKNTELSLQDIRRSSSQTEKTITDNSKSKKSVTFIEME
jgi:hypothetical protein